MINWFVSLSPIKGFKSKAIIVLRTREDHASPIPLEVCMDPPRVFFDWEAAVRKIQTTNNLHKRGIVMADWCYTWKSDGETVSYLLYTVLLLMICGLFSSAQLGLLGLCRILSTLCWSLGLECWDNVVMEQFGGQVQLVFYGAFGERNQRTFEGKELSSPHLKFFFLITLFEWALLSFTLSTSSLIKFPDSLHLCC